MFEFPQFSDIQKRAIYIALAAALAVGAIFFSLSRGNAQPSPQPTFTPVFTPALFCPFLPSLSYIMLLTQKPLTAWVCLVAKVSAKVPVLSISKGFAGAGIICLVFLCGWITLRWRSWA